MADPFSIASASPLLSRNGLNSTTQIGQPRTMEHATIRPFALWVWCDALNRLISYLRAIFHGSKKFLRCGDESPHSPLAQADDAQISKRAAFSIEERTLLRNVGKRR